jgi:NADH:ubiquinone oxidoreductase subunit E
MNNYRLFDNSTEVQVTFYNYYTTTSQQRNCLHTSDEVLCYLNGHTAGTTTFILETTVGIHNFVTVFIKLIKITAFSG